MNIECRKVQALMSLYIDNVLSHKLKNFVFNHLKNCEICMQKYEQLKKTMATLQEHFFRIASKLEGNEIFSLREYEDFKENVSAYLDDELKGKSAIKFKQYMEKIPAAGEFLEKSCAVNILLHKYFQSNMPLLKKDFSKTIVNHVKRDRIHENCKMFLKNVCTKLTK